MPLLRLSTSPDVEAGTIGAMPNLASILNEEISRVARKEVRAETQSLKKATSVCRSEIAALKRRVLALEQTLKRLGKSTAKTAPLTADGETSQSLRFSGKGLASQRQRLGLSAEDCGLLVGASGKSIYRWSPAWPVRGPITWPPSQRFALLARRKRRSGLLPFKKHDSPQTFGEILCPAPEQD